MSSSVNLEDFQISLEEFKRVTNNFDSWRFERGGYRGKLSERWQNCEAFIKRYKKEEYESQELEIVSRLHHRYIASFIGYCNEDDNYIYMAYEYFAHKSLDDILKTDSLTWASRLEICIRVAKVLNYLHSGVGKHGRVIHGDVKLENILVDKYSLELIKVCGFKHSKLVPLNQPHQHHYCPEELFEMSHTDPIYKETSLLNIESDIYSFGVLMFVILHWSNENLHQLMKLVRGCYDDGPYKLVDPDLRGDINHRSLQIFTTLAYKCISFDITERPGTVEIIKTIEKALAIQIKDGSTFKNTMLQTIEKFKIPPEEIRKAIGAEAFERRISSKPHRRMTYRGKLVDFCNDREVFFKQYWRRDTIRIQNELLLISSFHHENITPFIGVYFGDHDLILASEYARNGSLYLKLETRYENSCLTWAERLKICLGAARGLKYLHSGIGEHRVLHGDFKSKNIVLYDNLEAKICGFGKSFIVSRSHPETKIYKEARGSKYYMDPIYHESCILRVESNVYSFGVVLFEVLTGHLACKHPIEDERISMINWVRRYYDEIEKLIDYRIRDEIDARSLHMFKDIAYKCISFKMKDRPSMNQVVKRLEEALYIQTHAASSTIARNLQNLDYFQIPLKDINLAIGVKGQETWIGDGGFSFVYKGQLSERWQNRTVAIKRLRPDSYQGEYEFRSELNMIFSFSHENIIPFIGYCDEGKEKILVYDYASNGSLDRHLEDKEKRRVLTWKHRLKICLGAAKGLEYLHSGLGEGNSVTHRDVRSGKILLDHNFVAKVCDFGLSKSSPINQQHAEVYTKAAATNFYMDPVYHEGGVLRKESDVYSFGVVMFELLSGMLAYHQKRLEDGKPSPLINIVRRYYDYKPYLILDPMIRDEVDNRSFNAFREVAFQCISFNSKERPTMEMIVERVEEVLELQTHGAASTVSRKNKKLEDFRIPLEDINLAIGVKGPETRIGEGGFGVVYKGQPSERWQNRTVAIKCLRPDSYQGEHEFRNELNMIINFRHENIIPFIGYCDEGKEMIIVYEYASNGSIDSHLTDQNKRRFLTWEHRLKICLGAAKGLDYLHSGLGEDKRVIHRDVKSANILLDHNFVAKVCDFGLSKSGPINQQHTQLYTKAAGTNYYMDPVYHEGGVLRKESDVYSFGVVMFELLSGMLAYHQRKLEGGKHIPLINIVRRYYNYKPDLIIDPLIINEIDNRSFNTFREVAFQCISFNSKERPTMEMIVDWVEEALELQVINKGDLKQKVTES